MENANPISTRNIVVYFILILGGALLTLQIIDTRKTLVSIGNMYQYDYSYAESCIKYPLLSQLGLISIQMMVCTFLVIFSFIMLFEINNLTISLSFLNLNLLMFTLGPLMLSLSILGILYWNDICYYCVGYDSKIKELNIFMAISIIVQLLIGIIVTFSSSVYEILIFQIKSLTRKPDGSSVARKLFWWMAFKNRSNPNLEIYRNDENINQNSNQHYENEINNNENITNINVNNLEETSDNNFDNLNDKSSKYSVNSHTVIETSNDYRESRLKFFKQNNNADS